MRDEERLDELLLRWEELAESGQTASAEQLCEDVPHLAPELSRRIEEIQKMKWIDEFQQSHREPNMLSGLFADNGVAPVAPQVAGYQLITRLGRGGIGEVWKANGPDGLVALKIIPLAGTAAIIERRSLNIVRRVPHPALIRILDVLQTQEQLVIVMELADRTLLDRLMEVRASGGTGIPPEELLHYFRQAADAIDFLHTQGIHHRDLKPQNLLLLGDKLKVADFGLARTLNHSVSGHTGNLTVAYAAPEYFDGKTALQSDQYCLAITYCELRGGRLPHEGNPAQAIAGHLHRRPDLSMLPTEERPIVARALCKQPGKRWPNCKVFVATLGDPAKYRGSPLVQTRRLAWLIACVSVAVFVGMVLWFLFVRTPSLVVRYFEDHPDLRLVRSVSEGMISAAESRQVMLTNGGGNPALWDTYTGKLIHCLPTAGGPCAALAPFRAPEGLTGGEDGSVILWNLFDAKEIRRFRGHDDSVSSVSFSGDGRKVLTASCDGTMRIWNRATGEELQCCRGHDSFVMCAAFDPTITSAVSGGWDGTVRVWNMNTGEELKRFKGHTAHVQCVAVSADGRWVASGGDDKTVRLWDLKTGEEFRRLNAESHIRHLTVHGSEYVIAALDTHFRIWDANTGELLYLSPAIPDGIHSAAFTFSDVDPQAFLGSERSGLRAVPILFQQNK